MNFSTVVEITISRSFVIVGNNHYHRIVLKWAPERVGVQFQGRNGI